MARMKRFLPAIILAIALVASAVPLSAAPLSAAAADPLRYAVAADPDVWFYESETEEGRLFLIPESYYVRILLEGDTYTAVEYLVNDPPYRKLMGYCRTDALTFVDFIPARPFLRKQITVSYTIPGGETAFEDVFGSLDRAFVYYGMRYEYGQAYCYVLADGQFGYIPLDKEPEFERNDDYLSMTEAPVSGEGESGSQGLTPVQIVVICLACAAMAGIAIFVLRAKRRAPIPPDSDRSDF